MSGFTGNKILQFLHKKMNHVIFTIPIFFGASLTSGAEAKPLRPT